MHLILAKYFPDKSTAGPLWYQAWKKLLLLSFPPSLCPPASFQSKMGLWGQKWGSKKGICGALLWKVISWPVEDAVRFLSFHLWKIVLCMVLRGVWHVTLNTIPNSLTRICVFHIHAWQPDMGCDKKHQWSVQQAAVFHLFRVRWGCSLSLLWGLTSFSWELSLVLNVILIHLSHASVMLSSQVRRKELSWCSVSRISLCLGGLWSFPLTTPAFLTSDNQH